MNIFKIIYQQIKDHPDQLEIGSFREEEMDAEDKAEKQKWESAGGVTYYKEENGKTYTIDIKSQDQE